MTAILARPVRGLGYQSPAGASCILVAESQPGIWLVFVTDEEGFDRADYVRAADLIFDPTMEEV